MTKDNTALATVEHQPAGIVRSAGNIVEALEEYQRIQQGLDKSMPDAIMTIRDKKFRKKPYWRAIATAFNLDVRSVEERQVGVYPTDPEWGIVVTYRATAPNGRTADGDGSCFASEKARGRMEATYHNVRSHAHTRAFNRAVSNLVGFGEVSAEEAQRDEYPEPGSNDGPPPEEEPVRAAQAWRGKVKAITQRSGQGKRGPWTLYTVEGEDGQKFTTFDKKDAQFAKDAGPSPVRIDWEDSGKGGRNIVSIGPGDAA